MAENILVVKANLDTVYLAPLSGNESDNDEVDISEDLEEMEIEQNWCYLSS